MRNQKIIISICAAFFAALLVLNAAAVTWAGTQIGSFATASALLDTVGSTRGSIVTRTASGWAILPPSATVGHSLQSGGTGADLAYGAASGGTDLTGDANAIPTSANAFDDEFNGVALNGAWSQNTGSGTFTVANGGLAISSTNTNDSAAIYKSCGSTFKVRARVSCVPINSTNHQLFGLLVRESATGRQYHYMLGWNNSQKIACFRMTSFNAASGFGSTAIDTASVGGLNNFYAAFFEIEQDASNLHFRYSLDGQNCRTLLSESKTTHFTTGADQAGLVLWSAGVAAEGHCDWIRVQ